MKVVEVTDDYLGLDGEMKKCQNKESFENCTTTQYLSALKTGCSCIPYELKRFVTDMVKYHYIILCEDDLTVLFERKPVLARLLIAHRTSALTLHNA